MEKNGQAVIRFVPFVWATLTHLLLLAGVFALFMGRKPGVFRSANILELVPGFYSHVSNFSISYVLLAGIGYLWLMMGVSVRHVALAALILIAGNVIYEFFLPLLNTRDPMDAAYGVAGTLLAFAWLWVVNCEKRGQSDFPLLAADLEFTLTPLFAFVRRQTEI